MFHQLSKIDKEIFLKINHWPHPPALNLFFIIFDCLTNSGVVWLAICAWLILFGSRSGKTFAVIGLAALAFTLFFEGLLIKTLIVRRPRPFSAIDRVRLLGIRPRDFSFPSGQTACVFALAVFFWLFYGNPAFLAIGFPFGLMTGFGRIYLGAHYPFDVIGGIIIGVFLGWLFYLFFLQFPFILVN